jgi:hypothetical protein
MWAQACEGGRLARDLILSQIVKVQATRQQLIQCELTLFCQVGTLLHLYPQPQNLLRAFNIAGQRVFEGKEQVTLLLIDP